MASVNVNQLSEHLLKCAVCLETFATPKILPCLHSFCQKCLERIMKEGEDVLLCPTCRNDVKLPNGGVQDLPTNFFINNMLDFITIQSSRPIGCTNCTENLTAVARCCDCVEFLCEQCLAAHKRTKLTKEHDVLALKDLQNAPDEQQDSKTWHRPSYCKCHDREILKYYCKTCDDPVCRECLIMEHREHSYCYLKDVNNEQRKQVSALVESTKSQMDPLSQAIEKVSFIMERVDQRSEGIQGEISRNFSKCREVLKEKEDELLIFIKNESRAKSKVLGLQKENLETLLASVQSSCQFSENVLEHGNEAEVMLVKKQLMQRLKDLGTTHADLEPQDDDVIEYEFDPDEFRKAVMHTGRVKTSKTVPRRCYATGIGLHKAKAELESMFLVNTVDRYKQACDEGGEKLFVNVLPDKGEGFQGIVLDNNDGTYSVSYIPQTRGTHHIEVTIRDKHIQGSPFSVEVKGRIDYQKMGSTPRSFGRSGEGGGDFKQPWGVAIDNEREYVMVTDSGNNRVQVLDMCGEFLFKFGGQGVRNGQFRCPKGIAFAPQGFIIVADCNNHRLQVFNEDGRFLRAFGSQGTKSGQLSSPCGLCYCAEKNVIAVTEHDNHRVQIFNLHGEPVLMFGSQGGEQGQLLYPHHVAFTKKTEYLVSDCVNDRIQVFNEHGEFQFKFGGEGTKCAQFDGPEGVTVDDEGNILVCDNHNHRLQIFDAKGKFVAYIGAFGDAVGYFKNPVGIAVSDVGDIFVVDNGNNRVQIF